ncbi:MAG: undecaprenyl/decaprenyl-phosphate alpha-N-acetylglucosaminyl 1-phosphate transferase [Chloroflexi bacterium]|nr:undecaprenyl/decaprenyl-phosphate alpha-N-acetylglucosaminyl 1-phosphate transferase [Chloroflexota bacterium]
MILLLVFVTALVSALALTPLAMRLAARTGAMDRPAPRRVHHIPTPRFGGLSLFLSFLIALGVSLIYPRSDPDEMTRLAGLFFGGVIVFSVGAYDDHRELKALPQLAAQFIAASIAIAAGVVIRQLQNPFGDLMTFESWFAILVTLFWLIGMMNTINWLDGIDGLAAGVVAIAAGVMFIHSFFIQQQASIALLALALAGATIGFLKFNFFPAKIFMGTAGALVLGYAPGVISIIGGAKVATALLVLFIPVLDVAWQIIARVRAGKSPFQADRGHLHHRLLDLGLSQRAIVWIYYLITAIFGALALFLPHAASKLIALIVIGIGAVMTLFRIRTR